MVNLIQWFYDIYDCLHSLISLGMRDSGQLNVLCMYRSCFSLRSWIEYSRTRVNAISTNWLFCVLSPKYGWITTAVSTHSLFSQQQRHWSRFTDIYHPRTILFSQCLQFSKDAHCSAPPYPILIWAKHLDI